MPKVTYIDHDGTENSFDVKVGRSVMEGGVQNGVDGIVAECGGSCMCATCHVYVDEAWLSKIPAADDTELEMLENTASERKSNSRLSCQIPVTDELDGLVVRLPESQY